MPRIYAARRCAPLLLRHYDASHYYYLLLLRRQPLLLCAYGYSAIIIMILRPLLAPADVIIDILYVPRHITRHAGAQRRYACLRTVITVIITPQQLYAPKPHYATRSAYILRERESCFVSLRFIITYGAAWHASGMQRH